MCGCARFLPSLRDLDGGRLGVPGTEVPGYCHEVPPGPNTDSSFSTERLSRHFFQNADRRLFRRHQRADRDDEGLLQRVRGKGAASLHSPNL